MPFFWESVEVGKSNMNMYISMPSGAGPSPGVVVIHHAVGVDQFTRDMADRLADEGYAAVAPDLFHRMDESTTADGSTRREHLSDPDIEADINAAVELLRNRPDVSGESLGIIGFCMGGRVVWLGAAVNGYFKAAVPYYGGNIMVPWGAAARTPFERTSEINCPILFHFGEEDPNPSQDDMSTLDAELTRLGKPHEFFTYPDAGHGFMNHAGQSYHPVAAEASWPRTLAFFAKYLKG